MSRGRGACGLRVGVRVLRPVGRRDRRVVGKNPPISASTPPASTNHSPSPTSYERVQRAGSSQLDHHQREGHERDGAREPGQPSALERQAQDDHGAADRGHESRRHEEAGGPGVRLPVAPGSRARTRRSVRPTRGSSPAAGARPPHRTGSRGAQATGRAPRRHASPWCSYPHRDGGRSQPSLRPPSGHVRARLYPADTRSNHRDGIRPRAGGASAGRDADQHRVPDLRVGEQGPDQVEPCGPSLRHRPSVRDGVDLLGAELEPVVADGRDRTSPRRSRRPPRRRRTARTPRAGGRRGRVRGSPTARRPIRRRCGRRGPAPDRSRRGGGSWTTGARQSWGTWSVLA